ncbi:MAG: hypothetical protein ABSA45_09540 [Verrucomicrobiota bacterium]|jgi:hypothetical protein
MSNMILQCKDSGDFVPHPEGIHPAVCLDVMDLGLVETDFQGQKRLVNKVKIIFESEAKTDDGKRCSVSKSFTASLHPKAKLAEFIGKWRGRPVVPGESVDLGKLIGACCTLVISHQKNLVGKTYASIDAVSKPTRKVTPSGLYDSAAARQRYADWKAKQRGENGGLRMEDGRQPGKMSGGTPATAGGTPALPNPKSGAAVAATPPPDDFDPEVGF